MHTIIKLAFRNLAKRRIYSILNVLGLAVSISISYLLWLYVHDQNSFDKHITHANRIYRVNLESVFDKTILDSRAYYPVAATLKADYSEVLMATSFRRIGQQVTLSNQQRHITSEDVFASDPYFFEVFETEFIEGNQETALDEPFSMVISESYAMRLFDSANVVGNVIQVFGSRGPREVKITGVMKDHDKHTHLPLEALVSIRTYYDEAVELTSWVRGKAYTYIKLNDGNDIEGLRNKIPAFNKKYLLKKSKWQSSVLLFQPLTSIYLDPEYLYDPYPHGSRSNVEVLSIVLWFLLFIACINYVNLATALGIERAKEVGIRKTLGSSQTRLFGQFMLESIGLAVLSGVLALIICISLLPYYTYLTDIPTSFSSFFQAQNVLMVLLVSIVIGCVSGVYPALYLSSFVPSIMLKGKFSTSSKGLGLRKFLITSQYIISSVLLIGILIIKSQTAYIKHKDIGYNKENLIQVAVPDDKTILKNVQPFMNEIRDHTKVIGVSITEFDNLQTYNEAGELEIKGHDGMTTKVKLQGFMAGRDIVKTIGAKIIKGKGFDQSLDEDSRSFLVNETAVAAYGWKNHETELSHSYVNHNGKTITWKSIGVVSDFILGAAYRKQKPMILRFDNKVRHSSNLLIAIEKEEINQSIDQIKGAWSGFFPDHPFEFQFVEDNLNALYHKEEKFLRLLSVICFVIIFITSLGIIGLISFTTEMKRKEIAIRKVNGARLKAIIVLLSKQFVSLLLIANAVAIPVGYYLVKQWLANFEQRIDLTIWPFVLSIFICLIFTALALLYHTMRAARENPIHALQHE